MDLHLPLTVETLQCLAGNQLYQRLSLAIRCYHLLSLLYSETHSLPNHFGYTHLHTLLFSSQHGQKDPIQSCSDPNCLCQRQMSTWLEKILDLQKVWSCSPQEWEQHGKSYPFQVSRKTLNNTINYLVELGWLHRDRSNHQQRTDPNKFSRVSPQDWPHLPQKAGIDKWIYHDILNDLSFMDPRLPEILDSMTHEDPARRRFFVHVDFILSQDVAEQVEDLQVTLHTLWQQDPIVPVRVKYHTRDFGLQPLIVYPVSLHYARRAKYLSAYGETPYQSYGWHNFRLDRIQKLEPLSWPHPRIPEDLFHRYTHQHLPTPTEIEKAWEEAWGSDFYLPKVWLLIRFSAHFAHRYVIGTERHPTFQKIAYQQIPNQVRTTVREDKERQAILQILSNRSAQDSYFCAWIRLGDTNISMRLREWRPNGEVISPIQIREQMRAEVQQELAFYSL